jgi:hypothetical protein
MKQLRALAGLGLLLLMVNTASGVGPAGLEQALREVVEQNLAAYNSEDATATLDSVHTSSPIYADMRDALPKQFNALDSRTSLEGFAYIGHDDEFAVARVQYRTVSDSAKPFMNNTLDTITLFHQEAGEWKYWDHYVLGARVVE